MRSGPSLTALVDMGSRGMPHLDRAIRDAGGVVLFDLFETLFTEMHLDGPPRWANLSSELGLFGGFCVQDDRGPASTVSQARSPRRPTRRVCLGDRSCSSYSAGVLHHRREPSATTVDHRGIRVPVVEHANC